MFVMILLKKGKNMSATRVMLNLLVHEAGDAAFKTATTAALGSFLVDAATGFKHIISKDHNVDFFKKDDDAHQNQSLHARVRHHVRSKTFLED